MQNQFDIANYPDAVPAELTAGARWAWTRADITAAYPTASYTLKFRLCELAEPHVESTVTASKVDGAHIVEVAKADTAGAYVAGDYSWQAIIVRNSDSEEVQVDHGTLTILPDLDTAGVTASWVYQVLTAIRATIKGTASKEQSSYSIGGRSLALRSLAELIELEREFGRRWSKEQREINKKAGRPAGGRVLVKMSA